MNYVLIQVNVGEVNTTAVLWKQYDCSLEADLEDVLQLRRHVPPDDGHVHVASGDRAAHAAAGLHKQLQRHLRKIDGSMQDAHEYHIFETEAFWAATISCSVTCARLLFIGVDSDTFFSGNPDLKVEAFWIAGVVPGGVNSGQL